MKTNLLIFSFTCITASCFAQISFQEGYFINNEGRRTDCLIKDVGWKNNPSKFEYTIASTGESQVQTIDQVQLFEIKGQAKYVRASVDIDQSGVDFDDLSTEVQPDLKREQVFVEVLVEGKGSLYRFQKGNFTRYFFSADEAPIEQLIYKHYLISNSKIGTNSAFKQQLLTHFRCKNFPIKELEHLDFKEKELINFFINYNKCVNAPYTILKNAEKKLPLNVHLRPGVNWASLSISNNTSTTGDVDFGHKLSLRMGVELELMLPFNKNKWAITLEPTFQYFKSEVQVGNIPVVADYQAIAFPLGVRHYFFINETSKVFTNATYNFEIGMNPVIQAKIDSGIDLDIRSRLSISVGIGYTFQEKFSLEGRYTFRQDVLGDYVNWSSDFSRLSLILGYTLIRK